MTTDRITIERPSTNGSVPAGWLGVDFETARDDAGYDLLGRTLEAIAGYMGHVVLVSATAQAPASPPSRLWLKKGVWPVVEDLIAPSMLAVRGGSDWNEGVGLLSALASVASGRAGEALKASARSNNLTILTGSAESITDVVVVRRISLSHRLAGGHDGIPLTATPPLIPPGFLAVRAAGAFDDACASFMVTAPATWIEDFVDVLGIADGPFDEAMEYWPLARLDKS